MVRRVKDPARAHDSAKESPRPVRQAPPRTRVRRHGLEDYAQQAPLGDERERERREKNQRNVMPCRGAIGGPNADWRLNCCFQGRKRPDEAFRRWEDITHPPRQTGSIFRSASR